MKTGRLYDTGTGGKSREFPKGLDISSLFVICVVSWLVDNLELINEAFGISF